MGDDDNCHDLRDGQLRRPAGKLRCAGLAGNGCGNPDGLKTIGYTGEMEMRIMIHMAIALGVAGAVPALADQYVFPAKGQSEEQQRTDLAACEQWATQQTWVDLKALEAERTEKLAVADNMEVEREGGAAARGAIKGAVAGSLAGRDKLRNETAAAGALVGAAAAKKGEQAKAEQTRAQAKAQVEQAYAASKQEFYKARSVCLETKGYNVK